MSSTVELLKECLALDIGWINYFLGANPDYSRKYIIQQYKRKGLTYEIVRQVYRICRSFRNRFIRRQAEAKNYEILFFADSLNQFRAIRPVKERTIHAALWVDGNFPGELYFPADLARIISFLFLPLVFFQVHRKGSKIQRWTLAYGLSDYLDAYGYFLVGVVFLKKLKPKALVLSNDHGAQPRALMLAARLLSIPTVYLQHADVTSGFPPLEFDYALLEGTNALRKYAVKNSQCQIFLVGMARRTLKKEVREASLYSRLGVAVNHFDSSERIHSILSEIKDALPDMELVLRPHPNDRGRFQSLRNLCSAFGIRYSDPVVELPWQFLKHLDFVVAGNSAIVLEAALAGVVPLQHELLLQVQGYDYYGFNEYGIVRNIYSATEIKVLRENIMQVRQEVARRLDGYDITYGTNLDGKAAELAASVLNQKILKKENKYREFSTTLGDVRYFVLLT